jgi:predicted secreted protein
VVLVIRERDAVVDVKAGAPFDVRLASAPTTGYGWEIAHLPPAVDLLGSDFDISADAAVGDGGVQVFRLVASQPGRYELRFVLKRRWEQEPMEIRVVEVVADAPSP